MGRTEEAFANMGITVGVLMFIISGVWMVAAGIRSANNAVETARRKAVMRIEHTIVAVSTEGDSTTVCEESTGELKYVEGRLGNPGDTVYSNGFENRWYRKE